MSCYIWPSAAKLAISSGPPPPPFYLLKEGNQAMGERSKSTERRKAIDESGGSASRFAGFKVCKAAIIRMGQFPPAPPLPYSRILSCIPCWSTRFGDKIGPSHESLVSKTSQLTSPLVAVRPTLRELLVATMLANEMFSSCTAFRMGDTRWPEVGKLAH